MPKYQHGIRKHKYGYYTRFDGEQHDDPWKGDRDVANYTARDERVAEVGQHLATSAGKAVLQLPAFTEIQAPTDREKVTLEGNHEALRRPQNRSLFGERK